MQEHQGASSGGSEHRPTCDELVAENQRLRQRLAEVEPRIAELERQLEESRRASKRQSAPFSKNKPKEAWQTSGRKKGKALRRSRDSLRSLVIGGPFWAVARRHDARHHARRAPPLLRPVAPGEARRLRCNAGGARGPNEQHRSERPVVPLGTRVCATDQDRGSLLATPSRREKSDVFQLGSLRSPSTTFGRSLGASA